MESTSKALIAHDVSANADRARAIGRAVLALVAALGLDERAAVPTYFTRENPPPTHSWRAVLEHGRRGAFPILKRGRVALVRREDFDAWIASGQTRRRERPRLVRASDVASLDALGVKLAGAR